MKAYKIIDEELNREIGTLLYYDKEKRFIVELMDDLDEWTAPLTFTAYVKKGQFTMSREMSFIWVKERVIPSGRQNIKAILKNHKMKSYDEMRLLELSSGRCSQDALYIKSIDKLPGYVTKRMQKNLTECVVCDDAELLCIFADDVIKKVKLSGFMDVKDIDKVVINEKLLNSACVATGGYAVTFNDSIDIPSALLYERGVKIPLKKCDLLAIVEHNIIDTNESCKVLECTRQNLTYLIKQNKISPIKEDVRGNLFFKGDILKNRW